MNSPAVYFLAAFGAGVGVVARINPSEPYLRLDVPSGMHGPCVAVGYAGARAPSLEALVFKLAEISAEHLYSEVDVPDVVYASYGVQAEEMARERAAQPVAGLRLHEPVFPFVSGNGPEFPCADMSTVQSRATATSAPMPGLRKMSLMMLVFRAAFCERQGKGRVMAINATSGPDFLLTDSEKRLK